MITVLSPVGKTENKDNPHKLPRLLDAKCGNCSPITPLECITKCRVYKLKNELRYLWEAIDNPDYMIELFDVLKNRTRLHILQAIANARFSVGQLQQQLKNSGHSHSQDNIIREYLRPLIAVGIATVSREEYYTTTFGSRLTEQLDCFPQLADKLPGRSECFEEALLQSLLSGPKTFEQVEEVIPPKTVSRTLKRLRSVRLIKASKERAYVFFFKSKRDPNKETFIASERRIYDAISPEGTSAGKISKETGLCMRRTYKYLRGLKGKKLVFTRRTPMTYGLTCKGQRLALVLKNLQQIVEDTWNSSQRVMQESAPINELGGLSNNAVLS